MTTTKTLTATDWLLLALYRPWPRGTKFDVKASLSAAEFTCRGVTAEKAALAISKLPPDSEPYVFAVLKNGTNIVL